MIEENPTWLFANRFSLLSRTFFFVFIALTLIYMDGRLALLDQARLVISKVFSPMVQLMGKSAKQAESITSFFADTYTLQKRLHNLEGQAVQMEGQRLRLKALEKENERLRALLARAPSKDFTLVLAAPLRLGRNPLLSTALIDVGKDNGIEEGAVVIAKEGLIGQVSKTYAQYSEVMLVTDPRLLVPVEVNDILALASGNGEGQIEILYQPTTIAINKGSRVVTSGIGKPYPSHIPVGTVVSIDRNPNAPYARIVVAPAATINTAPMLAVLQLK